MSAATTAVVIGLACCAVAAKFISDATHDRRRKLLWLRLMQIAYLGLVVILATTLWPLARPYIEKIISSQ